MRRQTFLTMLGFGSTGALTAPELTEDQLDRQADKVVEAIDRLTRAVLVLAKQKSNQNLAAVDMQFRSQGLP